MKKFFKRLFCKHEWDEQNSIYDDDLTRTCIHCGKIQFCYCGDWYDVQDKRER
jgi:hypothetical protein